MYESKLESDGVRKWVVCYYDPKMKNWDDVISRALTKHKLEVGECPVICLPIRKRNDDRTYKKLCD